MLKYFRQPCGEAAAGLITVVAKDGGKQPREFGIPDIGSARIPYYFKEE